MFEKLNKILNNSYAPISNFNVSAVVVTKDGKEYNGVNVEDASTRAGTCAERAALFTAITDGCKKGDFKEINILTSSHKTSTPCFVCRQMMLEVMDKNCVVRCYNLDGEYDEYTVDELCPAPFEEEDLQ